MVGTITEIFGDTVKIVSEAGSFYGKWCSNKAPELKQYVLELDNDELICTENIIQTNIQKYFIKNDGVTIKVNGYVEDIQDNVMFFRLKESIIMFEVNPQNDFSSFMNIFLCITLNEINVYDVDVY